MSLGIVWFIVILALVALCLVLIFLLVKPKKHQGEMVVRKQENGMLTYRLEVNENPDGFQYMDYVTFKIVKDDIAG